MLFIYQTTKELSHIRCMCWK